MGLRRKQVLLQQKAYFENELRNRLSVLSGKGIKAPKSDKDTLVRKFQAEIRAVNRRLRAISDNEKRSGEAAKTKAERAAAPRSEPERGKGEKPKKVPEEGKSKKMKAPEGGKSQKTAETPAAGKPSTTKAEEKTKGEPVS